jgi:hypothetical protein
MQREGPPREVLADPQAAAEAGLRLPLITQLFHELRESGAEVDSLPLTVDEARRQLLAWMIPAAGNGRLPGGPP